MRHFIDPFPSGNAATNAWRERPLNMTPDSPQRPITEWVRALREKNHLAAAELWDSFHRRLETLAKRELAKLPAARSFDEQDVALSAFFTFCNQLQNGAFSKLANRDELWWLLIVITKRKAQDKTRHDHAVKRVGEHTDGDDPPPLFSLQDATEVEATNSDPGELVAMREQCQLLLDALQDDELRMIAIWKLEGHTNDEISNRLMRTRQTVQRKLNIIRSVWSSKLAEQDSDNATESSDSADHSSSS